MHQIEFPPKQLHDTVMKRRGRLNVFNTIDAAKTALVVIDMQNAFVADGAPIEVPTARGIVPNINALAQEVREAGGKVIWVVMSLSEDGPNNWKHYYKHFIRPERIEAHRGSLEEGSELQRIYPELDVDPADPVIPKKRFSAFVHGASQLEDFLSEQGIDTMLIAGTLTNVCCESTARDAMMRNFKVIMVSDANASISDEDHLYGLWTVYQAFGDVRTTADVCEMLRASNVKA